MKSLLCLPFCLLAHVAWAQDRPTQDTVAATPIIEKLFNTADRAIDLVSGENWAFIPAVTYSPETRLGLGVRAIRIFRPEKGSINHPSTLPVTFLYTLNKQVMLSAAVDLWQKENKNHLSARVEFSDYPFKFYGMGNHRQDKLEENYASKKAHAWLTYQKRLGQNIYIGPRYEYKWEDIYRCDEGGLLDSGKLRGSQGQSISGVGVALSFDSRNNIFQPDRGAFHQVQVMSFQPFLGSQYTFTRTVMDFRKYVAVHKQQVLALQAWYSLVTGDPPFQEVSLIGGSDIMRGHFEGKYRDRHAMVYQAEYRMPVYRKLRLVLFASAGQVAPKVSAYAFGRFKYGGGIGFRYRLTEEGLNIRLDIAYGAQKAFYFGLNEVL